MGNIKVIMIDGRIENYDVFIGFYPNKLVVKNIGQEEVCIHLSEIDNYIVYCPKSKLGNCDRGIPNDYEGKAILVKKYLKPMICAIDFNITDVIYDHLGNSEAVTLVGRNNIVLQQINVHMDSLKALVRDVMQYI